MSNELLIKIAVAGISILASLGISAGIFSALVKHFVLEYFKGNDEKTKAAFKRIDETRRELHDFKRMDWRDYKRDVALEFQAQKDSIKELYGRTDNHEEIKNLVDFCNKKNKRVNAGSNNER